MVLATVSRPDIGFAVSNVSKYLNSHNDRHWQVVKKIYRYLIGTPNIGIKYKSEGSKFQLIDFSDADYANDTETQ